MDIQPLVERAREHINSGTTPSGVARALFDEFGSFSAVYFISIFADAYDVYAGDIGYLFAGWWPDAPDSITDQEFDRVIYRVIAQKGNNNA
jgi:hypothetical protein